MLVTPLPIVTLVKPLQPLNALFPMFVTPLPIVTLIKPLQPENALSPMLVTQSGITTSPSTVATRIFPSAVSNKPSIDL